MAAVVILAWIGRQAVRPVPPAEQPEDDLVAVNAEPDPEPEPSSETEREIPEAEENDSQTQEDLSGEVYYNEETGDQQPQDTEDQQQQQTDGQTWGEDPATKDPPKMKIFG